MALASELLPEVVQATPDPDPRQSERAWQLQQRPEGDIPWWAIELLDLAHSDPLSRTRRVLRKGMPRGPETWDSFAALVELAEQTVCNQPLEAWLELAYNDTDHATGAPGPRGICKAVRDAALLNPRAFVSFIDLRDDEGRAIHPKDFHCQGIEAMRRSPRPTLILWPYFHGKTWTSSLLVPLLDWAEWPDATEGRVYLDEDNVRKWIGRLMQQVEENERLQRLFPWIRKPRRGDTCHGIWSSDGFAIGGRSIRDKSFEPLTIKSGRVGLRYMRTGVDDVVSDKEAETASIQEAYEARIKRAVLTFRQRVSQGTSRYGTVWPGLYITGTLYSPQDVNCRLKEEFEQKGYKVIRRDVYRHNNPATVIWPEERPASYIAQMREEMGTAAFNMRLRNLVGGRETHMFPEQDIDLSFRDGRNDLERFRWCVVPPQTRLMIGFDPGTGKFRSSNNIKYPAFSVYGIRDASYWAPGRTASQLRDPFGRQLSDSPQQPDVYHHVVQWGRLEGLGFHAQCQKLAELGRAYSCPVAVEDNATQTAFAEEIAKIAPDVTVLCHTTGENKRDPTQGVEQFEPILRNQRLCIHAEGAPAYEVKALRDELLHWPPRNDRKAVTDLLMALWIARYQASLHLQVSRPVGLSRRPLPAYVQRFAAPWRR